MPVVNFKHKNNPKKNDAELEGEMALAEGNTEAKARFVMVLALVIGLALAAFAVPVVVAGYLVQ